MKRVCLADVGQLVPRGKMRRTILPAAVFIGKRKVLLANGSDVLEDTHAWLLLLREIERVSVLIYSLEGGLEKSILNP